MNYLKEIWDGNQINPDINAIYSRLKISDCIKQVQGEYRGAELSTKRMGKGLHKLFNAFVNELKDSLPTLPTLGESGS